jgi:ATP-dependent RNA helicase RhlE
MISFHDLKLSTVLLENITRAGYLTPTEIQAEAIPVLLQGKDLLGIAQTGTGKTAAFCLPILQKLISDSHKRTMGSPRVLIVAPTRELCSQIVENLKLYSHELDVRSCAIFGGVGQKEQVSAIKAGIDIIVATPGRLLDLLEQNILNISKIEVLVLDEADRMLDEGFMDDIENIIHRVPRERHTMLFSATMPGSIARLASKLLRNPVRVEVSAPSSTSHKIEQKMIFCKEAHKFQLLRKIIKEEPGLVLVFTTSRLKADEVVEYLLQNNIATGAIHADKKQAERERHLANFKNEAIKVMVASDIAARGIDVEGVTHVINFDLPLSAETYIHRIGRTGRAGKAGKAISFCDEKELRLLEKIKTALPYEIPTEKFEGKFEELRLRAQVVKKKKAPTPGKSQEKTAYLDHSKRQRVKEDGTKIHHPGFRKTKKKRR